MKEGNLLINQSKCQYLLLPPPQTPRPKPRFIFSEKSSVIDAYESFAKEGFAHLLTHQAEFPFQFEKRFLSKVDLSKGPILVSVTSMVRTMAVDPDSPKRDRKEYMYYTTEWQAKDSLGNQIILTRIRKANT